MASFWDFLPAVITAGATLYGANQANKAKQQAAETLAATQKAATAAQQQGLAAATQNTQQLQQQASPGLTANLNIIGRGDTLTPVQTQALDDARRTTLDSLAGGSLRGSARATSATVNDVEGRMRDQFIQDNRNRADTAASNLSGQYFNAGNNISNLNAKAGDTASAGLTNTGNIIGQNILGQGAVAGTAIGDIGSVIADSLKKQSRPSSYNTNATAGQENL